jgi:TonB-linked outer membrane protein, SusC/RagA family/TonB-dependent outer membrane receptor, SusC/RagA subfamily, signature region
MIVLAQNITVTGTVVDESNLPVIGATVYQKDKPTNGASTDVDGKYTISLPSNAVMVISCIGYNEQEVPVNQRANINVTLKESSMLLNEVVVTGYGGTQLRSKTTNSIAKVSEETFKVGVFSNPAQALSGAVSGLRVTNNSGNPGATPSIVLRGGTNLDGSGSPLVLIDGQLRGINDVNPEDIESISILKDAGSTALYGARASNGVILITTKTGRKGTSAINFKGRVGLSYLNNPYEFVGAEDYITTIRRAYHNSPWASLSTLTASTPFGTGNKMGPKMIWNIMGYSDENAYLLEKGWQETKDPVTGERILFKDTDPTDFNFNNPALIQDYNLNMSGGNDKGSYYAGLGYNNSEGLPITSFYKRYNFTFNGSYNINDWLTSRSNFSYNRSNWRSMPGSQGSEANYFGRVISVPRTVRYEDEDGNKLLGPNAGDGNQSYQPEKWQVDNQSEKFTMIQSIEIKFLKNLTLKGTANWFYNEQVLESFTKDYENTLGVWRRNRNTSAQFGRTFAQTYNAVLNYNEVFANDHNVEAMLGGELYDSYSKGFYAAGSGAPTDDFADLGLTLTEEGKRSIDSWHSQIRIASLFGRVNYDYLGKYLLSGVFRYDGYSTLLGDNRWGFFPGVSAGWIFGKESFVKDNIPALSFGKLRMSYGVNGNASGLGAYDLQGSYGTAKYNGNVGFLIGALPNPGLRWEKSKTFEVGLDLSFFENRLNANLTYYNRLTEDKYANLSLPSTTGFSSIRNNNGKFRNRGIELELSGDIIRKKDFTWSASANIAYNKNIIVALPDNGLLNNRQGGTEVYTGKKNPDGTYETIFVGGYQEGQEPGIFATYIYDGIYKSVDEIPGNLVDQSGSNAYGQKMYGPDAWAALTAAQKRSAREIVPGDVRWKDINGDGIIDSKDRKVIGNLTPRWIGGLNTTLSYKGLSLYARVDFGLDFWTYDRATPWFLGCMQGTYAPTTDVFDTWTPENPNAKYPRYVFADQLGTGNYFRYTSQFAYKGDYLALRELSLSYQLPSSILEKIKCKGLELSVSGQNLGYLKKAPIATPETGISPAIASGIGYGLPRIILFGVNLTF